MTKLAIITTYHGKFPNTIDFWIKSVAYNSTIDFFLFTDLEVKNPPKNLIVVNKSFKEIADMAQANFDFPIKCTRPYKYPDYRPAFGEIFHDYVKDYDFWGYSEHDMMYGDIRKFLTDDIFDKYDRVLAQGHLSFYRNTPEINARYKECPYPTYKSVYSEERNFYFEEMGGVKQGGTSRFWINKYNDKFYRNRNILDDVECLNFHFERLEDQGKDVSNVIYSFEKGHVYRIYLQQGKVRKEETLYMHFQKRALEICTTNVDTYMVVPNRIIDIIANIDKDQLKNLSKKKLFYIPSFKIRKNRLKDRWLWLTKPVKMDMK